MSNITTQNPSSTLGSSNSLMNFQLDNLSIKEKSELSYGKSLAEYIEATVVGGTASYFWQRNQRWKINRMYANGKIPMQKFQDLFEFNGKVNYTNLLWMPINICNRIICGLVGRWMDRSEKIQVTAIDTLSVNQKQDQYEELEFIVENKRMLERLQQESGVQMIPQDQNIPADTDELKLWQHQFQRIPEEIIYETGCNDVLGSNGFFDVNKEKLLHDSSEVGFLGTETFMDEDGVVHVKWLKPENCFYSYSEYPDFRDTTWRGYLSSMKISEIRKKYGVEFGGRLSEEEIFQIAQTAKDYQLYDNITWNTSWNISFLRPYDEWNVDVMSFELKTVDTESYTVTVTKKNKSTLIRKGKPEKKEPNDEIIDDTKCNIYRGVYVRSVKKMLEWGIKKNMIRPQDPKELGNAEFSYSFYMPQSYDMTSLAVPEKIQEPVDQMIAVCLRMQQLIAKMRPHGAAVNWDALQNIDYGLGDANKTIDPKKLYDQTGDIYYRGRDAEGNAIPVPITELTNSGFLPQMQGLVELYRFHYQVLKDELGEDPNLITQAATPRVAVSNIDTAQQEAVYATDYMYRGFVRVMEDTSRKISCLLKDSVIYGSKAYRKIINEEIAGKRIFTTKISLLPDVQQIAKFEALMNQAIASNPDLVLFIDPFQLMRVAREDVKMAEVLFRQGQKKMLQHQQQVAMQNQQMTIEGQIKAAQTAEQEKRATKEMEIEGDVKRSQVAGLANNQTAVLNMVAGLLKPAGEGKANAQIPSYLMPLINATIENVMVGAVAASEEQKMQLQIQTQAAREQQEQPQQQPEQQMQQAV